MKRLLGSTAALSLALAPVQPWPLWAQTDGSVQCDPSQDANCPPPGDNGAAQAAAEEAARAQAEAEAQAAAQAQAEAEARAAEEAAAQAEAEAQAAAQAQAEAEARAAEEAAAQAAAEEAAKAQAEAEAKAAEEAAAQAAAEEAAKAQAEAEAAAQAAADEAAKAQAEADAKAAADAAAADEAAKAQAEADAKAAEDAATATEEPAPAETATEAPATTEPVTPEAPVTTEQPATEEPAATGEAATEEPATEQPATQEPAAQDSATQEPAVTGEPATATDEAAPAEPATGEAAVTDETAPEAASADQPADQPATAEEIIPPTVTLPEPTAKVVDPAAGLATAAPDTATAAEAPVDVPEVTPTQVESLSEILADPNAVKPEGLEAAALAERHMPPSSEDDRGKLAEMPAPKDAAVQVETLTEHDSRRADQEFAAPPVLLKDGKKSGLSDLEKVGLVVLGALVVGTVINQGRKDERRVVSNTGDRIVVLRPDGTYEVYKDDDTILRRPGSTVRTERFRDGSTRTIVERGDGTQVVTVRDASGRVLRRAQYDRLGRELVLIDDFYEEEPVIVTKLPKPRHDRVTISTSDDNAALKAALAAKEAKKAGRSFSLRQIREIPEVRALAATIDVDNVTFDSGSSAIKAGEAENLADLGGLMQDLLEANPAEVFLVEGHTDAVGNAAMNLALSDRRAESVALALTEYFDIPPENMVVQGYGESELLIDTQKDERANRRVVVRVITPLMKKGK